MKNDKKYGGFSYSSRSFRKSLALLCLAALLIPAASMTAKASGTAAAQTDMEMPIQQKLTFYIPEISLYYGQQLKAAYLSGTAADEAGQAVSGTFSWVYPETVITQLGTVQAQAAFTVLTADSSMEEICFLSVPVTVEPGPVHIVEDPVAAGALKAGIQLKDIPLEGGRAVVGYPLSYEEQVMEDGAVVDGSFAWAEPDYVLTEGTQQVRVLFTPAGKEYRVSETYLTLEATAPGKPEEPEEPEEPKQPQTPQLYLSCPDIFYGQKVKAEAWADGSVQPSITYTYEGNMETVYPESQTPPKNPGDYLAYAAVHRSELFHDTFLYEAFRIKRPVPEIRITADRTEVTGGGRVNLKISIRNPYDEGLKEGLPDTVKMEFEGKPAIQIVQNVTGKEGNYTASFAVPNESGTITCIISAQGNDFYRRGESAVTVQIKKKEKPSEENRDEDSDRDDHDQDDQKQESQKEKEDEPVIKTPEEVEAEFWQDVIFRIYRAQEKGETVTINAKGHGQMPDKVMEALRGHKKVTLALVWDGDMILIPAGKAADAKKGNAAWTLMELSKQYPAPKPPAVSNPQAAPNLPAPAKPAANPPQKPSSVQNHTTSSGNTGSGTFAGTEAVKPEHTEEDSEAEREETTEAETETKRMETAAESTEAEAEETEIQAETEEPADPQQETDWFTIAACVCAGAGLIAVLAGIAALVMKNKDDF